MKKKKIQINLLPLNIGSTVYAYCNTQHQDLVIFFRYPFTSILFDVGWAGIKDKVVFLPYLLFNFQIEKKK